MKVYSIPEEIPFPEPDYGNYDVEVERKREKDHQEALRAWLREEGFAGPDSGKILSMPHADGYARYMLAEGQGRRDFLLHLPYADAYHSRDAEFLPKKEVIKRVRQDENMRSIFDKAPAVV